MPRPPHIRRSRRLDCCTAILLGALTQLAVPLPVLGRPGTLSAESQACQECHALPDWEINDPVTGRTVHLSIDSQRYEHSSHGSVPCRSCHDWGYDEIPHRGSSQHPIYECVFCHENDSGLEYLRLSERKRDLRRSVHGDTEAGPLDCHTCHDPHDFRPVNESDDALLRIEQSNAICLGCHAAETNPRARFAQEDVVSKHELFPDYENHLRKVKCVVCHTRWIDNATATRHEILKGSDALSDCERCHTQNSAVLDAIYGPQRFGVAASARPPHADLIGDAYVIGSTRSPRLERLSFVGFVAICLAIALHGLARMAFALRVGRTNEGR